MGRKAFISFLGASNYGECEYVKDGTSYGRTRFIQTSTIKYLRDKFGFDEEDTYLILLTRDAKSKNWLDNEQKGEDGQPLQCKGLKSELEEMSVPYSTLEDLPIGNNEEEILTIFERIYQFTQEGDELYFDITHGFRYLPMLVLVLGHFSKFLKDTKIVSITYGNYEVSERGTKPGPIVDLSYLNLLLDWTTAASLFVKDGDVDMLTRLNKEEAGKGFKGGKKDGRLFLEAHATRTITDKKLPGFIEDVRNNRGMDIVLSEKYAHMKEVYDAIEKSGSSPIFLLLEKIMGSLGDFIPENEVKNGFAAAAWCFGKGLYQQSVTFLQESIVTCLCHHFSLAIDNREARTAIGAALGFCGESSGIYNPSKEYEPFERVILESPQCDEIRTWFQKIADVRNDYNHAGFREKIIPPFKLKTGIGESLSYFWGNGGDAYGRFIDIVSTLDIPSPPRKEGTPLFINLSNHPTSMWKEAQLKAAKELGKILDFWFPDVDPTCTPEQVERMAEEQMGKLTDAAKEEGAIPSSTHVHIMGEMTLTLALIGKLKKAGFDCIASTSKRNVYYNEKGEKVVEFNFVQFRRY